MHAELISIATPTTPLDGVFYRPDGPARGAVLLFHGNTMNFYTGAPRFLPPVLVPRGWACLAFNRRGHDILAIRDSRAAEGAAFQTTAEGIADNRLAAAWLAAQGFPSPIVIGHSNGGMLATQHVVDHPDTPALVLLSAHRGESGPALLPGFAKSGLLAGADAAATLERAQALVAAGCGQELMLVPGWWYVISAASYVDRMTTMPSVLDLAPLITCPTLYVRGDEEDGHAYPAETFKLRAGGPCDAVVMPQCDHFYRGCEDRVAALVAGWLDGVGGAT